MLAADGGGRRGRGAGEDQESHGHVEGDLRRRFYFGAFRGCRAEG